MDSKAIKNILNQALTFLVIFLIVNFVYNQFFNQPATPKTGLQFFVAQKQLGQNDLVTAHIENFTTQDVTLKNHCPEPAIQVEELKNGQWVPKTYSAKLNCANIQDVIIKPGEKYAYSFHSWNHEIFGELGNYRLKAQIGDQSMESSQFEVVNMSFFGWLWSTIIYQPIYNALIFFTSIVPGNNLGLAIILLTILIRTLLLLPNQKALKSQKKLQNLQPKLAELKEKHGGDQQKMAAETLSLYKEHKVSPFGSCLPLLIQLPILIGLFNVIQTGIDPGSSYLLYPPLANFDLSQVQTNFYGLLELTKIDFIVLPILVGLLQFLQLRLSMGMGKKSKTEKKPKSEMEMANRTMTIIMPFMIGFFTASVPSGVGLYWAFSTIYGICQQLVVNKSHDKNETQIQVVTPKNKDKKELYKELTEQRKAAKETGSNNAEGTDTVKTEPSDSEPKPPVTIIKA
jgi:YidC/Oxa1 family membrane protein insertase